MTQLVCVLCLVIAHQCFAALSFEQLESEKGIDLVRDICRSDDGYVWVASNSQGLIRFDGYSTKWYRVDNENPESISSNSTWTLTEGHDGSMWVGTRAGLERLDRKTDSFQNYKHNPTDPNSLADNRVMDLHYDDDGTLWVLTKLALHRYIPESDNFIRCHEYVGQRPAPNYYQMEWDSDGVFWITSSNNGVHRFDSATNQMDFYPYTGGNGHLWGKQSLEIDPDGKTLWMAISQTGLLRFDKIAQSFYHYPIDPEQTGKGVMGIATSDLIHIDNDTLVIGVEQGGISILNKKDDTFTYITEHNDGAAGLTTNGISRLYKDQEGILWLGTFRGGLFYSNPSHYSFKTHRSESLSGSIISSIFEDSEGKVWIGIEGNGINILDRNTNKFRTINTGNSDLSSNRIRSFSEDAIGNIWVATWNGGINRYDRTTDEIVPVEYPEAVKQALKNRKGTWRFHIDKADRFWIITNLITLLLDNQFNLQGSFFTSASVQYRSGRLYQFEEDTIYFSNNRGIYRYDEDTSQMIPLILGLNAIQLTKSKGNGNFYVATRNQGLYELDSKGKILRHLTTDDGLSDNSIKAFELVNDTTLWISTIHGLNLVDLKDNTVSCFFEKDGLQGNSYFIQCSTTLQDGTLAFGGTRGISLWKPSETEYKPFDAPIYIQNIQILNQEADLGKLVKLRSDGTQEVRLDWDAKMIRFEFAAVGFTYPKNIRYEYMLEGFDEEWVQTDSQNRKATYTNLSPGSYKLLVRASDNQGNRTPHTATLHLKVTPPFWMSLWFYFILLLLSLYAIRHYLKHRDQKLEAAQEKLLQEVAERSQLIDQITESKNQAELSDRLKSQFLANMSHEIRTPMNAIIGFSELLADDQLSSEDRKSFLENITNGADSLLRLIEDILDISMIEANQLKVKLHDFSLVDLLNKTHSSFIVFQPSDTVELKYTPPPPELTNAILHSDSQRLRQIITNLVNNALKFTYSGSVELGCRSGADSIVIFVKDTGDGIDAAEIDAIFSEFVRLERHDQAAVRGVGLGLAISKRLTDLLGFKLEVESTKGVGSEFRLVIPKENISIELMAPENSAPSDEPIGALQFNWEDQSILIVEDENSNSQYLQSVLKTTNIQIDWARNGKEAIQCIREKETRYDLVLMDINMPIMDGYEAITIIKILHPRLIVIAQTAYAMQEDMTKCLEAGFDDYLSKPILPNVLIHMIAKYIKN